MKHYFLTLLFLLVAGVASAQELSLSGKVLDAADADMPIAMATVRLMKNDTLQVAACATEADGTFSLKAKSAGIYKVNIAFVGYETLVKRVELTAKRPHVELGNLLLVPDEKLLREVSVTGLAQELTIKADTFVYHANAYRVPEGATIAALIKQLPGLSMDSDGNLTFQGKAVSSILVNGKPFIGDANTAMSNIVSDAVEEVAVYEKTDEEKEFAGVLDLEKATVVDLKIKKEYMSSWNVNVDGGAGTKGKYLAKAFASNFTDKRRTAVYAQVNNISENQSVDENGNWRSGWGGGDGLFTYRKAGTIMSWDNGKANDAAGLLKLNTEIEVGHDNSEHDRMNNVETLLGSAGSHWSYNRALVSTAMHDVNANIDFTYNIDSLSRLSANLVYDYYDTDMNASENTSVYSAAAGFENPELGLVGDAVSGELAAVGVNSHKILSDNYGNRNNFGADVRFIHRFRKEGYSLKAGVEYYRGNYGTSANSLSVYRYFNSADSAVVQRRYTEDPSSNDKFSARVALNGAITKNIQFEVNYHYKYEKEDESYSLYRLDRYPYYATPGLPLGVRPSAADSLAAVIDIENSAYSVLTTHLHNGRFYLYGKWEKIDANIGTTVLYHDDRLDYERAGMEYAPERKYVEFAPLASLRWRFAKNGTLYVQYYGYERRQSLLELLPITDTSNEMVERVNNPNLKVGWSNNFNMTGRWFNEKRGDSYHVNANYGNHLNSVVDIIQTDPLTGKMLHTKDNVNGNYYLFVGGGTEQPLDKDRHWTLSLSAGYSLNRNNNYVGALGDELGLSVIHSHDPYGNMRLKWRSGMWSVNLTAGYSGDYVRYESTPQYDQNGHTFECNFEPQVELPWGMRVNSSFGFYGRRGYADDIMNHDQWLWNATISQSFLKSKALTLQLEAVDILGQRTSEYSVITPTQRSYSRNKVFQSYVMLHVIYRFDIGGKQ